MTEQAGGTSGFAYDVFVSHASEDKGPFVDDLVRALGERGVRVWYDSFQIALGDDFRRKMEQGLLGSRFGVVVVSPSFLSPLKAWTKNELSALFNFEAVRGEKRILPVLYGVSRRTLTESLPMLATRRASDASELGVDKVADQIHAAVSEAIPVAMRAGSPLYGVPLPSQSFVGRRQELERLKAEFRCGDVRVCAAIEGLPGIGKTELVLKLAYELAAVGEFPGGIFWLSAESPDLVAGWADDSIAGALGIAGENARERALATVNHLNRRSASLLVILDNVEQWETQHQPAPLPSGSHVTLLVTTRRSHLGGSRFRSFPLHFLLGPEARALVTGIGGGDIAAQPGFDALLEHLSGHALALELAGIYLREYRDVTPAGYLAKLHAGKEPDAEVAEETRHEHGVAQAFALLWHRLDERTRFYWQLASWFAPEPVSAALADTCGLDADGRRTLHKYHLVELDREGRFRMHRLTRDFGRRAGDREDRARAKHSFLKGIVERAELIDVNAGFRIYGPDRAHFDEAVGVAENDPAETNLWLLLLDGVGLALQSMGELRSSKELLDTALDSILKNFGEHHPSVARRRSNLAGVLQALGDLPRARQLLEAALVWALRSFGDYHPNVAMIQSNLAVVLQALGDLPRARELFEAALVSAVKNFGEDHPTVATLQSNLAVVLQALGDLPRARELLEAALVSDLKNFGEDHPSVATSRSNLALVLRAFGELLPARELLEAALVSDLRNFSEDHPSVAKSQSNLGVILHVLGDLPRAQELLEAALASALKNFGEDHPSVAMCWSNLAVLLQELGELSRARKLLEAALSSDLKNFAEGHPNVAKSQSNLAMALQELGELSRARELLEAALASGLKSFGEDHPSVTTCQSNLAGVLKDLGELSRARELLEAALASGLKNLGEDHPSVALRRYKLAAAVEAQGDRNAALHLVHQVLASQEKSLGRDHPARARTRAKLADLLLKLGQHENATQEVREALRVVATQPAGSSHRRAVEAIAARILEGESR